MDTQLGEFQRFLSATDVWFDDRAIEFFHSPLHGYGVRAKAAIKEGQVVARIPKRALLSVETATLWQNVNHQVAAGQCHDHGHPRDAVLDSLFQLPAAAYFEALLGERSKWRGYLRVLPQDMKAIGSPLSEDVPEVMELWKGTGIDVLTREMRNKLQKAFAKLKGFLLERAQELSLEVDVCFEGFVLAFGWVTSRAFQVDKRVGPCLVPIADMFNHRTDGEHVHIEGNAENEESASEGEESDEDDEVHDEEDENKQQQRPELGESDEDKVEQRGEEEEGYSLPGEIDEKRGRAMQGEELQRQEEVYTGGAGNGADDHLQITSVQAAKQGDELFNTFGQKSSTLLYLNYGFTEARNEYEIALVHRSVVETALRSLNLQMTKERQTYVDAVESVFCDDVLDGFFQIVADGSFCVSLMLLIYVHIAPWKTLGEDEIGVLEHVAGLAITDIVDVGRKEVQSVVEGIVQSQMKHLGQVQVEMMEGEAGLRMGHARRVRTAQRDVLKTAADALLRLPRRNGDPDLGEQESNKMVTTTATPTTTGQKGIMGDLTPAQHLDLTTTDVTVSDPKKRQIKRARTASWS